MDLSMGLHAHVLEGRLYFMPETLWRAADHGLPSWCVLLQGGGVRLNNEKISDEQQIVTEESLIEGRLMLIAAGKKNKMLVRLLR
jgi:hypothetical protein